MHVQVFKGSSFTKNNSIPPSKIITFDLDETLGDFANLCILWHKIVDWIPITIEHNVVFRGLVELFPECIRPGIPSILEFLYKKKKIGICSHIFLYTNNQRSPEWVQLILEYFEETMPHLFDKTICAFKIKDQRIEPLRTTHSKVYNDLIRCTLLPKNAQICFIDNTYHPKMEHERVYYIQPKSYQHGISGEEMIKRFLENWSMFPIPENAENLLHESTWKSSQRLTKPLAVSQKIMYYLKEYFLLSMKQPKTKKIGWTLGRFTRKKRVSVIKDE